MAWRLWESEWGALKVGPSAVLLEGVLVRASLRCELGHVLAASLVVLSSVAASGTTLGTPSSRPRTCLL